jgi:hypothetical protein
MSAALMKRAMGGPTLSASISGSVSGGCGSPGAGNCSATTSAATITPANGSGSYSYSWVYVSGSTANAGSPTNATSTFSRTGAKSLSGNVIVGTYLGRVTDTVTGLTADTPTFTVTTIHTDTT